MCAQLRKPLKAPLAPYHIPDVLRCGTAIPETPLIGHREGPRISTTTTVGLHVFPSGGIPKRVDDRLVLGIIVK